MRLYTLVCLSGLAHASLTLGPGSQAFQHLDQNLAGEGRALDGLGLLNGFGGDTREHPSASITLPFVPTLAFPTSSDAADDKKKTKTSDSTTTSTGTSSIIGTPSPLTPTAPSSLSGSPITSHAPSASPNITSAPVPPNNSTASSGTSEWKIIGVAVIAFSVVAAILLLSVFFDHWWRFVRDIVWRKRKKVSDEELVPDWEKAEWELRLARDPELARYPSFASFPSSLPSVPIVQHAAQGQTSHTQAPVSSPMPPQSALGRSASRREAQTKALERGVGDQQEQRLARRMSVSRQHQHPASSAGIAGVGTGLGLGRVDSVKKDARAHSTPQKADAGRTSPRRKSTQPGRAGAVKEEDPFADVHSPTLMPEDVYGGIE
ncbi:hypothetical protein DICSQDRAFT_165092 [Dichomitus squalens LYAD-421 SS1]|uniref:uncharacterized protein n=1 Tax=Dichomitus squalens (strain LYAD-421) TaxID=732165 RepID=UPI0004411498|nr:uncharacterized protein DICSQDRAFT_165092 [Dichomitus squalens LYAD-421 SS1]EJF67267.1 hypothetical protein DICSQDRAFT_165092 [Dichomitus squalens LYAD-421 SS1]